MVGTGSSHRGNVFSHRSMHSHLKTVTVVIILGWCVYVFSAINVPLIDEVGSLYSI